MFCIWWDHLRGEVYYAFLKPDETITGALYQTVIEIEYTRKKRVHYYFRYEKIVLQHDNALPHIAVPLKPYLETPLVFTRHCFFDYHFFRSMAYLRSTSYTKKS